jgi:hypothetical protein
MRADAVGVTHIFAIFVAFANPTGESSLRIHSSNPSAESRSEGANVIDDHFVWDTTLSGN